MNSQKFSCLTKLVNLLCLYTVGIISSANLLESLIINESPASDQQAVNVKLINVDRRPKRYQRCTDLPMSGLQFSIM
jgi:hypothetical protein